MSLAWAPIAIILLLLPGVFFFIGLASYERLSREIIRSGAVSEIAMATGIALAIHFFAIAVLSMFGFRLSEFVIPLAEFSTVRTDEFVRRATAKLTSSIIYLGVTSACGFVLGLAVAVGVVSGPLRRIALHRWIYDLVDADRKRGIVTAYVMTTMFFDSKVIMYKGRVHDVFLGAEGKISYIVLKNCSKYYMEFKDGVLETGRQLELFGSRQEGRSSHAWDRLMIDGDKIANVLFDSSPEIKSEAEGERALNRAFEETLRTIASQRAQAKL